MENLWKSVILAEEVVKFLLYNKYYMILGSTNMYNFAKKQSYDIAPLLR